MFASCTRLSATATQAVRYPFFVARNNNGNLPVYSAIRNGGTRLQVSIRNVNGDVNVGCLVCLPFDLSNLTLTGTRKGNILFSVPRRLCRSTENENPNKPQPCRDIRRTMGTGRVGMAKGQGLLGLLLFLVARNASRGYDLALFNSGRWTGLSSTCRRCPVQTLVHNPRVGFMLRLGPPLPISSPSIDFSGLSNFYLPSLQPSCRPPHPLKASQLPLSPRAQEALASPPQPQPVPAVSVRAEATLAPLVSVESL